MGKNLIKKICKENGIKNIKEILEQDELDKKNLLKER